MKPQSHNANLKINCHVGSSTTLSWCQYSVDSPKILLDLFLCFKYFSSRQKKKKSLASLSPKIF